MSKLNEIEYRRICRHARSCFVLIDEELKSLKQREIKVNQQEIMIQTLKQELTEREENLYAQIQDLEKTKIEIEQFTKEKKRFAQSQWEDLKKISEEVHSLKNKENELIQKETAQIIEYDTLERQKRILADRQIKLDSQIEENLQISVGLKRELQKIEELKLDAQKRLIEIETLTKEIEQKKIEQDEKTEELNNKEAQIRERNNILDAKEKDIIQREKEIKDLVAQIRRKET